MKKTFKMKNLDCSQLRCKDGGRYQKDLRCKRCYCKLYDSETDLGLR